MLAPCFGIRIEWAGKPYLNGQGVEIECLMSLHTIDTRDTKGGLLF